MQHGRVSARQVRKGRENPAWMSRGAPPASKGARRAEVRIFTRERERFARVDGLLSPCRVRSLSLTVFFAWCANIYIYWYCDLDVCTSSRPIVLSYYNSSSHFSRRFFTGPTTLGLSSQESSTYNLALDDARIRIHVVVWCALYL